MEVILEKDFTICIGTIGSGVWQSPDGGDTWNKIGLPFPPPGEYDVRALRVYPDNPRRIIAGSDVGIYRSEDSGASWEKLASPMDGMEIWSLGINPSNTNMILVGTKPPGVFRSKDGGATWEKLPVDIVEECRGSAPKVTTIVFDPRDNNIVWVGVEIDGIFRSLDGGDSWIRLPDLGPDPFHQDIHGIAISQDQQTRIMATCPKGVFSSVDMGESWDLHSFPLFDPEDQFSYSRGIIIKPDDPRVIFVAHGDIIPGTIGDIQCSRDGGRSWKATTMSDRPNSTIYWLAANPADSERLVANSIFGELYLSEDGGDSWEKLPREFGEIRALSWSPK